MEKVIVLLGKHGDIASVANYYIKKYDDKPVWVVNQSYASILHDLFPDRFHVVPVDIPVTSPIKAAIFARYRYPSHQIIIAQQNGYDTNFEGVRQFRTFEEFQKGQV